MPKQEDEFTAGFARVIASITDSHVIYPRRLSLTDPNWDPDAPYKKHLRWIIERQAVRFVIDVHGAGEHCAFGIALGTLNARSCPHQRQAIQQILLKHRTLIDKSKSLSPRKHVSNQPLFIT